MIHELLKLLAARRGEFPETHGQRILSVREIRAYLIRHRIQVSEFTIQGWIDGRGMKPRVEEVLRGWMRELKGKGNAKN